MRTERPKNPIAPEGTVWLCGACGRQGRDRHALGDTSCVTWAVLVQEASIQREADGTVRAEAAFVEEPDL